MREWRRYINNLAVFVSAVVSWVVGTGIWNDTLNWDDTGTWVD